MAVDRDHVTQVIHVLTNTTLNRSHSQELQAPLPQGNAGVVACLTEVVAKGTSGTAGAKTRLKLLLMFIALPTTFGELKLNDSIHPTLAPAPSPTLAGDLHPLSARRSRLLQARRLLPGARTLPPVPHLPGPAVLLPAQWARSRTHCASSFPAGLPGAGVSSLTRHGRRRLLPRSVREAEDSRGRRRIPAERRERRERRVGDSPCGEGLQAASGSGLRRSPRSSLFPEDPRERPGRGALSAPVTRCAKFKRTRKVFKILEVKSTDPGHTLPRF
ncbi:uncharacterized protein LOC114680271 [Macaca mulatta]